MIKHIIVALLLCNAIYTEETKGISWIQHIDYKWDNRYNIDSAINVPLLFDNGKNPGFKMVKVSPVMWHKYTVMPKQDLDRYIGGVDCTIDSSCRDTGKATTIAWDKQANHNLNVNQVTLRWSWDKTDPREMTEVMPAYLADVGEHPALWPRKFGLHDMHKDYELLSILGLSPQSDYFAYLRQVYPKLAKEDITFRIDVELEKNKFNETIEDLEDVVNTTEGKVLRDSMLTMNIGQGQIGEGELKSFPIDTTVPDLWTIGNTKLMFETEGKKDTLRGGRGCFSNYYHNSIIAIKNPATFRSMYIQKICAKNTYSQCKGQKVDIEKAPLLELAFVDGVDGVEYVYVLKPEEYLYVQEDENTGEMLFQGDLIGDLRYAVDGGACPSDTEIAVGNLFYLTHNINFVSKVKDNAAGTRYGVIMIGAKPEELTGLKTAIVWLGIILIVAFFLVILYLKSLSAPLEKVDDMNAPYGTIGNSEQMVADDEDDYAKVPDQ